MKFLRNLFGKKQPVATPSSIQPTKQMQPAQEIVYPEEKDSDIKDLIIKRGLRPLGNKKRLTHTTEEDDYDVRLLLFRDKASAETYYDQFISYAKNNPPPFVIWNGSVHRIP